MFANETHKSPCYCETVMISFHFSRNPNISGQLHCKWFNTINIIHFMYHWIISKCYKPIFEILCDSLHIVPFKFFKVNGTSHWKLVILLHFMQINCILWHFHCFHTFPWKCMHFQAFRKTFTRLDNFLVNYSLMNCYRIRNCSNVFLGDICWPF